MVPWEWGSPVLRLFPVLGWAWRADAPAPPWVSLAQTVLSHCPSSQNLGLSVVPCFTLNQLTGKSEDEPSGFA